MSTIKKPAAAAQADDFIRIQDLFYLCLSHWAWFVISLAITVGIALFYILSTPPVYKRTASLLIKEDGKSQSISSDVASMFSDMGLSAGQSNVYNELSAIQSPAILLETGKRLALDIDYQVSGPFHRNTLYGKELPVKVLFYGLSDTESVSMTVRLLDKHRVELSDFEKSDQEDLSDKPVEVRLNSVAKTPVGKLLVMPAPAFDSHLAADNAPIYVSRTNLYDMTKRLQTNLSAAISEEKATLIDISYKDVLTDRATDVINTLIAVYRESWMKDKNQMTVATSNFITERLGVIERELGDVDQNISSYKSSHLLPDVEAASSLYMEQSKENSAELLKLTTQRSMAMYVKAYLTTASKENQLLPVNSGIESPAIEAQISEYNNTQLERNSLVANSSEKNPLVADLDQSLASQKSAILSSIDNLVVTINTQISHLQQNEQKTNTQIASNPDQAKYLQSVGRQQKVKEALYLFLLQKREENELSQAFTAYNTRIISPPSGELKPVAPVKRNILLVAVLIGLLLPVVVIFVRENMNTKVRGRKDLENVSVPLLGEIPHYVPGHMKKRKWQVWKKIPEVRTIVVKEGKRDIINEAFRVLRTNIEFMAAGKKEAQGGNVIILTSFNPGSGKTFLTMNICVSLAIKQKRVLVIDGDLRRGCLTEYIDHAEQGLSNYLGGQVDDVRSLIVPDARVANLSLLPVGTIPPNPTELLFSDRLPRMIEDLRQDYDYIFIDCPPVDIVADTQIIEKVADRTFFVVRAGLLDRAMLREAETYYQEQKLKNMSLILNGTEVSHGSYGHSYYRYGYGYGYGYGNYYGSHKQNRGDN